MASHDITFSGSSGHRLAARLERPAGPNRAVAIFAHCFTCTMRSHAATRITAALAVVGIANYLRDAVGARAILIGHSLGGAAVLAASARVPEAHAVDLTDALRARLTAVAAKCPVHRTLTSSLHIHTMVER